MKIKDFERELKTHYGSRAAAEKFCDERNLIFIE
jgi:hypothetical protein